MPDLFNALKQLHKRGYASFEQGADALFNLCDAQLGEPQTRLVVELSQSLRFEQQKPSAYQVRSFGQIDKAALRKVWVHTFLQNSLRDPPIWLSVDTSRTR